MFHSAASRDCVVAVALEKVHARTAPRRTTGRPVEFLYGRWQSGSAPEQGCTTRAEAYACTLQIVVPLADRAPAPMGYGQNSNHLRKGCKKRLRRLFQEIFGRRMLRRLVCTWIDVETRAETKMVNCWVGADQLPLQWRRRLPYDAPRVRKKHVETTNVQERAGIGIAGEQIMQMSDSDMEGLILGSAAPCHYGWRGQRPAPEKRPHAIPWRCL